MAGYTRQSTADIIPTATVRAAPINAEYNAIRDAFAASGGHKHDGTTGEGEYIPLIADLDALNKIVVDTTNNRFGVFIEVGATAVEQVRFQDGVIVPVTDNDIDLGTSALEFKNLYLDGTAKIDTLTVDENATIAGTLGVTSNTTLGGTLAVTGATTLSSTLGVTGNTTLSGTLGVTGATTLSSTLAVTGSATLSSTLSVSSNATVGGTLAVTGTTSSTGDFSVNTNKFNVAAGTGNTAVAGTLDVTGNTTVGGTLGVTGAATLSSTAAISGNTTIGGTLGVTGTTTYSTLTGSNLTATGTINFAGATVSNLGTVTTAAIGGGTINNTVIGGSTPAAITGTTITGTSFVGPVTGNVTGDITGDVTGNVTASSGASTFNNVTINGTLDVTNTTIENVSDPTTAQQAATKAYVDSEITSLIGGAPAALDTLNELAAAINDDENVYTTLTTSIATKLPKSGGTMTGAIAMGNNKITGLATPTADADATTKAYVDQIETDAEAQATAAAASAAAAAASYDSFDDRYLGSKASDPTLDNDNNALITGALYFDSTNGVMKVYNGTEWVNASSSIEGIKSNFYYTATSGQTAFSGADDNTNTLVVDQVDLVNVYMNGVRLHEDDYTVSAAGNSVTLATGAATGDLIYLEVFGNFAGQSGAEVAITGGNIDGTVIGGSTPAAISGTTGQFDTSLNVDGTVTADGLTVDGDAVFTTGDTIRLNTADGSDNGVLAVAGGGGNSDARGAKVRFYGNEHSSLGGVLDLAAGNVSGGHIYNFTGAKLRQKIDYNGDLSLYEDTGTTAKFFWDASAESLGIGTDSPSEVLHLRNTLGGENGAILIEAFSPNIKFNDLSSPVSDYQILVNDSFNIKRDAAGDGTFEATDLTIDSSGNVGIGTSSFAYSSSGRGLLEVNGSTSALMGLKVNNVAGGYLYDNGTSVSIGAPAGRNITFDINGEKMRIDSSGNLLVGKTSADDGATEGAELNSNDTAYFTRSGGAGVVVNRKTSDGNIAVFQKDGSTVGSIGTRTSGLRIDKGNTNLVVYDDGTTNSFFPESSGDDVDLGLSASGFQWKDLYLSGGVFLGGTGSANHLDDYEEGTFVATLRGGSSEPATLVTTTGKYTKVGRNVTFQIEFSGVSTTGYSGEATVQGLPFSTVSAFRHTFTTSTYSMLTFTETLTSVISANSTTIQPISNRSGGSWQACQHNAGGSRFLVVTGTYLTT